MEEFNGTPGPWQVVDDYDDYHEYSPETPQIYIWNGDEQAHKAICDMGEMGDFNYAEELANANLISAAPELLDALQILLFDFESIVKDSGSQPSVIIAKDAIKKALTPNHSR